MDVGGDSRCLSREKAGVRNGISLCMARTSTVVQHEGHAAERSRGCVIAHEDVTDRKRAEEALRDSFQRLQALSREVQLAEERERSRLSRELHDEFGQVLTGLKFDLMDLAGTVVKPRGGSITASRRKIMRALGMVDRLFASLRKWYRASGHRCWMSWGWCRPWKVWQRTSRSGQACAVES